MLAAITCIATQRLTVAPAGLDDSVFRRRGPPFAHPDDTDDDEDAIDDADQAAFDDF